MQENWADGSGMIAILVIADFERTMPGIQPGPLGWHTNALTPELQEKGLSLCGLHWLLAISR